MAGLAAHLTTPNLVELCRLSTTEASGHQLLSSASWLTGLLGVLRLLCARLACPAHLKVALFPHVTTAQCSSTCGSPGWGRCQRGLRAVWPACLPMPVLKLLACPQVDATGSTPLHSAAFEGFLEGCGLLLQMVRAATKREGRDGGMASTNTALASLLNSSQFKLYIHQVC